MSTTSDADAVIAAARAWKAAEDAFYESMLSGGYVTNAMITPLLRRRTEAERALKRAVERYNDIGASREDSLTPPPSAA